MHKRCFLIRWFSSDLSFFSSLCNSLSRRFSKVTSTQSLRHWWKWWCERISLNFAALIYGGTVNFWFVNRGLTGKRPIPLRAARFVECHLDVGPARGFFIGHFGLSLVIELQTTPRKRFRDLFFRVRVSHVRFAMPTVLRQNGRRFLSNNRKYCLKLSFKNRFLSWNSFFGIIFLFYKKHIYIYIFQ